MASYVVVGFKVNNKRSVYYGTAHDLEACLKAVRTAFEKREAEFISLRKIPNTIEEGG